MLPRVTPPVAGVHTDPRVGLLRAIWPTGPRSKFARDPAGSEIGVEAAAQQRPVAIVLVPQAMFCQFFKMSTYRLSADR